MQKTPLNKETPNGEIKNVLNHFIRNKILIVRFKLTNIGFPRRAVISVLVFIEGVLEKLFILHK